jgi:hypothetical protein
MPQAPMQPPQMRPMMQPGMPMMQPGQPIPQQQPILNQQMPQAQPAGNANIQLDPFGA